jgi:Na+-driven multidrug efflux pump
MSVIATADALFVARLGATPLAGVTLVFPVTMLMHQVAASGIGGAVTAATARALGADRRDDVTALAIHALVIAGAMAALFTVAGVVFGRRIFAALGGEGAALDAAVTYATIVFGGAAAPWLYNTLASFVRGMGNMRLPAAVIVVVAVTDLTLSPMLMFGWGPWRPLGVAGAGLGFVAAFTVGALLLGSHLVARRAALERSASRVRLERRLFGEILRVGGPGALNVLVTNAVVVVTTGLVAHVDPGALAGFGVAARLEYVLIAVIFSVGTATAAMVTGVAAAIGGIAALAPRLWIALFSTDPAVVATGSAYLRIIGPAYACYGLGIALYYAAQGFGRVFWPVSANVVRLVVVAGVGAIVVHTSAGVGGIFAASAAGFVVYGVLVLLTVRAGSWADPETLAREREKGVLRGSEERHDSERRLAI